VNRTSTEWLVAGLPTVGVADAGGCVPGDCDHFAVAFLDPYGVVVIEVNDGSERDAAVEAVLDVRVAGIAGDAGLDPCVAGDHFCPGQIEIFHDSCGLGVFTEVGVQEAMRTGVLVGVGEG